MNKVFLTVIFFSILLISCTNDNRTELVQNSCELINFKYYNGSQDNLGDLSNDYILIAVDTIYNDDEIQNLISTLNQFDQNYNYSIHTNDQYKFKEIPLKLNSSKNCNEIAQIISELEQNIIIDYAHYTMQTDDCNNSFWEPMGEVCIISYGSNFHIKVFDENNLADLNQMIDQTKTEIVRQNQFMEKWFELRATKNSNGDALAMANFFYESGLFEHSEPGISKYPVE